MTVVDYWFDPICPWSWATSRWMNKVTDVADVEVHWHPMSLALLNASEESPLAEFNAISIGPIRVCAAVYAREPDKLGALYTEIGTRFHHAGDWQEASRGQDFFTVVEAYQQNSETIIPKVAQALAAVGLSPDYLGAADDASYDDVIIASHGNVPSGAQMQELIGVPTISVDGQAALFGPVISEVPTDADVLDLWTAFSTLSRNPNFFELKRTTSRPAPLSARG